MDTTSVRVRYWAGAEAAAGVQTEDLDVSGANPVTVGHVRRAALAAHPTMGDGVARCSALADGRRLDDDAVVAEGVTVELLPPFAGG